MSADNWTVCPRCERDRQDKLAADRTAVAEMYGRVPVAEFDAARAALISREAKEHRPTFREDYEIYGADEGVLIISYSGYCEVCGLKFEHQSEHPLPV